jgi:hypothetical protein
MPNATSSDQKTKEAIVAALPIPPDSEDQKRMYEALAGGLARWQFIETGLYLTALTLMGTDQTTCSLAFFQIKAAENKLAFVDRLIFHKLDQRTRIKIWKPISDEIRAAIDFRNSLAHFEMFNLTVEEFAKIKPKTASRAVLSTHHLDHHAKRGGSVKALSVEMINHNTNQLRVLTYRLIYFVVDHLPQTEQLLASLQPHLRQWLDSFRKMPRPPGFEPPRKSFRRKS